MKDNINLQHNTSCISKPCESCGQYGHTFNGCAMIKFHSNKHRQIFNYNQLNQPYRQPKTRRDATFTTLQCAQEVKDSVIGFHEHIFYMQKLIYKSHSLFIILDLKEENDGKQLNNYCTMEDDDDYDDFDPDNNQNKNNEEHDQTMIDSEDKESRNQIAQLTGLEEQNTIDENNKNNIKKNSFNPSNLQSLHIHGQKKQNQNRLSISMRNSLFARKLSMKSQDTSEDESVSEDNHHFKNQDFNPVHSQFSRLSQFSKENTHLSTFYQYSGKEIDRGEQKVDKLNLEQIIEEDNKETLRTEQNIQDGVQESTNFQENIQNLFKSKFFPKKTDDLRRQSRYISASQLPKQLSINLLDVNSPQKRAFSPNNSVSQSPRMNFGEFTNSVNHQTITPRGLERTTLKSGQQIKELQGSMVANMCEQTAKKENLAKDNQYPTIEIEKDFDVMKEYEIYFIHNNPSQVIEKANQIIENNNVSKQINKEKSIRRKKKAVTTKVKYEKKNFNLLQKKQTPQKGQQQNANMNKMPMDWIQQQELEKSPEIGKLESDGLIIEDIQTLDIRK